MKRETWKPGSCCVGLNPAVTYTAQGCEEIATGPDRLCDDCRRGNKPKHTPGPWRVTVKGSGIGIVASANKDNPHGQHIASMSSGPGRNPIGNATLIAAAPDLAAALAALVAECSAARVPTAAQWCAAQDALRKAGL